MSFDDHMSKLAENRENIEDRNVGPDEFSHDQWALARFGSTYGDEEELDTERKENDCFDHLVPDDMVDCHTYGDHDPGFHPTEEVLYSKCKYCYLDWRIPSFPDGTTILTPDVYEGDVEVQGVAIDPYDDNAAYVYVRIHYAGRFGDKTLHNYHKLLPTDEGWRVKQNKSQPSAVSRTAEWLCENAPAE